MGDSSSSSSDENSDDLAVDQLKAVLNMVIDSINRGEYDEFLMENEEDDDESSTKQQQQGRSEAEMKAIRALPPFEGAKNIDDNDPFLGFCFDKKQPGGQRYKIEYHSAAERAWCECSELVDQKLWQEADKLFLDEVQYYQRFDHELYSKIRIGIALESKQDEDFQEAMEYLVRAIHQQADLHETLFRLVNHRLYHMGIPKTIYDDEPPIQSEWSSDDDSSAANDDSDHGMESIHLDYDKVQEAHLLRASIKAWFDVAKVHQNAYSCLTSPYDGHLDALHCVCSALVKLDPKGQESLKLIQSTTSKLLKYGIEPSEISGDGYRSIVLAFHAGSSEALGDMAGANKSYAALKEDYSSSDEEQNLVEQFLGTELVPTGTLDERIERTAEA